MDKCGIHLNNGLWGLDYKSQTLETKTDRYHQSKKVLQSKKTLTRGKNHPLEWKKTFAYHIPSKQYSILLRNSRKLILRRKAHVFE